MSQESLKTDVQLLKKDVEQISEFLKRLDVAIEKLSEVSTGISKIIAVHDKRMEVNERTDQQIFDILEDRKNEHEDDKSKLYSRINSVEKHVNDRVTDNHNRVLERIGELESHNQTQFQRLEQRLQSLDRWRWLMIGGGAVAGFLANYIMQIASTIL